MTLASAVVAKNFQRSTIYTPPNPPFYACWPCLFPGEKGQWYVAFEEVTGTDPPLPQCTPQQWYEFSGGPGMDKSQFLMEAVILESRDNMATWREVSRKAYNFQHTVGIYGASARTTDGKFIRFIWSGYNLDPKPGPNEVFEVSLDNGRTWVNQGPFHDEHFLSWAHRLRTLRDGTLVLCLPFGTPYPTKRYPIRTCSEPDAIGGFGMNLFFSYDQAATWEGPLLIYPGQSVSETDFVELPTGDLLFINNSIFAHPGRQFVYRKGKRFTPGPLELARGKMKWGEPNHVPETVCLIEDNILVGCMRAGVYSWSDDLGLTWFSLAGADHKTGEVYQPVMHHLGNNRVVCCGHFGHDDPIREIEGRTYKTINHTINLHFFDVAIARKTLAPEVTLERVPAPGLERWPNSYALTLTQAGNPLSGKELTFWYAELGKPGYDDWNRNTLDERMAMGGTKISVVTDQEGKARVDLEQMDQVAQDEHRYYQCVVLFNDGYRYPEYKPVRSAQYGFYADFRRDPPLS